MTTMNKKTGAALLAAGLAAGVAGKSVFIDNDGGGVVVQYVSYYDEMAKKDQKIVIRGSCRSSCTIGLGYKNVCLGPDAVLGFHPAYTPILFGVFHYVLNPAANQLMLSHYPPDARAVIDKHVDLTKDTGGWFYPAVTYIKGSEFPAHYQCRTTPA